MWCLLDGDYPALEDVLSGVFPHTSSFMTGFACDEVNDGKIQLTVSESNKKRKEGKDDMRQRLSVCICACSCVFVVCLCPEVEAFRKRLISLR